MIDYEPFIEALASTIAESPGRIIIIFLVITAIFATGLGNITTQTGTSQFVENMPAQEALEDVNQKFGLTFQPDPVGTTIIQTSQNVLSKPALIRMLRAQKRAATRPDLRVISTSSVAQQIALHLNPKARTLSAKIRTLERATATEIDRAVYNLAKFPGFRRLLSDDFNRKTATASATIGIVQHKIPGGTATLAGTSGESPLQSIQIELRHVIQAGTGEFIVFGSGIVSQEFSKIIFDSLILVIPAASLLILFFLIIAYRDPIDLILGLIALVITIIWTFGFLGLAGIAFTQLLIAIPPLLLAVGIDFGIHAVNRYREERTANNQIQAAMKTTVNQLFVAFFIVTGTTILGFSANLTSSLGPIRDFGLIASIGIAFTFLIFGIFMPATKVFLDQQRLKLQIPSFGRSPLGQEGSVLGGILPIGVTIARYIPRLFVIFLIILTAITFSYGAGVDTTFSQEDFLPPEDIPDYLHDLPEPFRPSSYTVTDTLNFLEQNFKTNQQGQVIMYVQGPMRADYALEQIQHASHTPPDSFITRNRRAQSTSIIDVIHAYASQSVAFRQLINRNDADNDGVPDDNLKAIYDALLDSPYRQQALQYITPNYRSARIVYDVKAEATQAAITSDAKTLASQYRFTATATGQIIIFQAVADTILKSAIRSLLIALVMTAIFLVLIYWVFEGDASLGLVNLFPILVSVGLIAGSMRFLHIPFNALTATVLAIAIGLGVDYSAHITHRFADEFTGNNLYPALMDTMRGTGGALTGSMLTTAFGLGVLVLAITPILGQFGIVTALAIVYSYLTAIFVTPSAVVVWHDAKQVFATHSHPSQASIND